MENQITQKHLNQIIKSLDYAPSVYKTDEVLTQEFYNKLFQAKTDLINSTIEVMVGAYVGAIVEDIKEKYDIDYKSQIIEGYLK